MEVDLEVAYAEACQAIGERVVKDRLIAKLNQPNQEPVAEVHPEPEPEITINEEPLSDQSNHAGQS